MLVRKLTEPDIEYTAIDRKQNYPSVDEHIKAATNSGIGDEYKKLVEIGTQYNLYPRLWKTSIMFAPPTKRTICLFTIWTAPVKGKVKAYVASSSIAEYYQLPIAKVEEVLGTNGWRYMGNEEIQQLSQGLSSLMTEDQFQESC